LLSRKQEFIRKIVYPKKGKRAGRVTVTFNELQETFNLRAGLKQGDSTTYANRFIREVLRSMVHSENIGFPPSFNKANKDINKVKTTDGVLAKLGWMEKVPSSYKLNDVLFNPLKVEETQEGKRMLSFFKESELKERNFSLPEYRAAVLCCLPRIDPLSSDKLEAQLSRTPLQVDYSTIKMFEKGKMPLMAPTLDQAYAFHVSAKNAKSKTKLEHYEIARNTFLATTKNVIFTDKRGTTYHSISEIPKNVDAFLRKKYKYPMKKRELDESSMEIDSQKIVEAVKAPSSLPTQVAKAGKVARVVRKETASKRQKST